MRFLILAFIAAPIFLSVDACRPVAPTDELNRQCVNACEKQVPVPCDDAACERGCRIILDRVVEREIATVLACIQSEKKGCRDAQWASCGASVPYRDGGPPPPLPPKEEDEP
jgi:hypothetical protein